MKARRPAMSTWSFLIILLVLLAGMFFMRPLFKRPAPAPATGVQVEPKPEAGKAKEAPEQTMNYRIPEKPAGQKGPLRPSISSLPAAAVVSYEAEDVSDLCAAFPPSKKITEKVNERAERNRRYEEAIVKQERDRIRRNAGI